MKINYKPRGICSRAINLELEDGIIKDVEIIGGCSGNLQGICRLVKGKPAREVAGLLKGIRCGNKPTSCPDQLTVALSEAMRKE